MTRQREIVTEFDAATGPWEKGVGKIERRLGQFERRVESRLGKIDKRLDGVGRAFESVAGKVGGATKAIRGSTIAVAGLTAGFTALVVKSFEFAESIADQSAKTGVAVEALQELQFAADQNGASARDMTDALTRLQRRIGLFVTDGAGPAKVGIEALGLEQDILSGKLRGTEDVFVAVTERLSQLGSQAEISAVASAFFGDDAGPRLAALLAQGTDGLERFRNQARALGLVMQEDLVKRAGETNARMRQLSTTISHRVMAAVIELEPRIRKATEALIEALPAMTAFVQGVFDGIAALGEGVDRVTDNIARLRISLTGIAESDTAASLRDNLGFAGLNRELAETSRLLDTARERLDAFDNGSRRRRRRRGERDTIVAEIARLEATQAKLRDALTNGDASPAAPTIAPTPEAVSILDQARSVIEQTQAAEEGIADALERQAEARAPEDVATDATARLEDAQARLVERTAETGDEARAAFESFARGIFSTVRQAESLDQALGQISNRLLEMAANQIFEQIFSAAMGGGGGGGFGGFNPFSLGGLPFAAGGLVRGPGGPTSDSIPARLSDGEYVVNARATAQNLDLLEAINGGGAMARFAEGGFVGAPRPAQPVSGLGVGAVSLQTTVNVSVAAGAGGDDPKAAGQNIGRAVERAVEASMIKQMRSGGVLDRAISQRMAGRR